MIATQTDILNLRLRLYAQIPGPRSEAIRESLLSSLMRDVADVARANLFGEYPSDRQVENALWDRVFDSVRLAGVSPLGSRELTTALTATIKEASGYVYDHRRAPSAESGRAAE